MRTLTEKEAEEFLEKHSFQVAKRVFITHKEELKKIKIKFPWVMKISSKHIVHKAKMGGTKLNINSPEEAGRAFSELSKIEKFEGALVQEMVPGEEIILGLKKTPEFGIVVMFGKGGSRVEEEKDVSFRTIPLKASDVKEMIKEVKYFKILTEKNVNFKLLEKNIIQMSKLAEKYSNISELDINPLIVNSKEAKVADARIVLE